MALFQVIKDGNKEIVVQDSTQFSYKPDGKTKFYAVQRVMYKQNSWMPPAFVNVGGKKYLMPKWLRYILKHNLVMSFGKNLKLKSNNLKW